LPWDVGALKAIKPAEFQNTIEITGKTACRSFQYGIVNFTVETDILLTQNVRRLPSSAFPAKNAQRKPTGEHKKAASDNR